MEVQAGRNFDRRMQSDSSAIIVNQAFLRKFNIYDPESAVNEEIQFGSDEDNDKYQIIGIVKDFNRTSLKSSVEPSLYLPWLNPSSTVISFQPNQYREGIAFLEEKWAEFFPMRPWTMSF